MEIKLEHVLLFLLFVLFLKMIRDKCGCNRVVEGVGARPRKAAPANQPPKKHTTPPTPDTGDFVNFTSEDWSYSAPIDTFAYLAQCNPNGTGGEVTACLTNATNTSGKQCENFYTKTVGGKGGYHKCKTKWEQNEWGWFGGPTTYTCISSDTRCKPARPCGDGATCVNISALRLDPSRYNLVSYEFTDPIDETAGHVTGFQNGTSHTYVKGSGVYKVMEHLKNKLQIQKIQVEKYEDKYKISLWVNSDVTWTLWDKTGDQYDVGGYRNIVNHKITVNYSSADPMLEFITHNG